jgi:hypothetical protein
VVLVAKKDHRTEKSVVLAPGDTLPAGTFVAGWKLDPDIHEGQDLLYLHYVPEKSDDEG